MWMWIKWRALPQLYTLPFGLLLQLSFLLIWSSSAVHQTIQNSKPNCGFYQKWMKPIPVFFWGGTKPEPKVKINSADPTIANGLHFCVSLYFKIHSESGTDCCWSDLSESSADWSAARSFISVSVCDRAEWRLRYVSQQQANVTRTDTVTMTST